MNKSPIQPNGLAHRANTTTTRCCSTGSISLVFAVMASLFFLPFSSLADDLSQLYEKAYFLETAKGQTEKALKIYRTIAATEVTDENRAVVEKTLKRMLNFYALQNLPESTKQDQLEKAIALKVNGLHKQAAEILQKLSLPRSVVRPDNTKEHTFHHNVLDELLELAVLENDQKQIADIQERKFKETDETIHSLIMQMPDGGTIYLPNGVYSGNKLAYRNIWIKKEITLKGERREKCIIEGTMDRPIIDAGQGCRLTLDNLTIKSQMLTFKTAENFPDIGCALKISNNGEVTITNCNVTAMGNMNRSPLAILADGFAKLELVDSRISGYAAPVFFGEGSTGSIKSSILENQLCTRPKTEVTIENTILHDSDYLAVDCNGGKLKLQSCLLINAEETAIGVGSATEEFAMVNSLVFNCGTILQNQRSHVNQKGTINLTNNVFAMNIAEESNPLTQESRSYHPDECHFKNNILFQNKLIGWNHTLRMECIKSDTNIYWENELEKTFARPPKEALIINPEFTDAANGDFAPKTPKVAEAGHGLTDPGVIAGLWKKYKKMKP